MRRTSGSTPISRASTSRIADDYAASCVAQAAAFLPVERRSTQPARRWSSPTGTSAADATLLARRPAALGLTPPAPCGPPPIDSEAAIWGGAYVLEGSRLGGAMLKRDVAGPVAPNVPCAPVRRKASWRQFVADA